MIGHDTQPRCGVQKKYAARGFSLLELMAVLMLLGVLATVGISRMHRGTLLNMGGQGDARRVALDLHQAHRRAISSGDNHLVRFTLVSGKATRFAVYRRTGSGDVRMEAERTVADGVTIVPSAVDNEFTFDGTSLAAYSIAVTGSGKSWTVSVIPATGFIRVVQNP